MSFDCSIKPNNFWLVQTSLLTILCRVLLPKFIHLKVVVLPFFKGDAMVVVTGEAFSLVVLDLLHHLTFLPNLFVKCVRSWAILPLCVIIASTIPIKPHLPRLSLLITPPFHLLPFWLLTISSFLTLQQHIILRLILNIST